MDWEKIKSEEKIWNLILKFFKEKKKLNPDYIDVQDNHIGYLETDSVHAVLRFIVIDDRFLFDFFDEQKIYIVVNWYWMQSFDYDEKSGEDVEISPTSKLYKGRLQWSYRIFALRIPNFESRPEAEEAAWLKAFEILEDRQNEMVKE